MGTKRLSGPSELVICFNLKPGTALPVIDISPIDAALLIRTSESYSKCSEYFLAKDSKSKDFVRASAEFY